MRLKERLREKALEMGFEDVGFIGISRKKVSKWKMNAARALGVLGTRYNVPTLINAMTGGPHDIVRGMFAWVLGRLGGCRAITALEAQKNKENGIVKVEIEQALTSPL